MNYFALKYIHIIGATVLIGMGIGMASFIIMAARARDAHVIASLTRLVSIANLIFSIVAVMTQPITGLFLVPYAGSITDPWITRSIILYLVAGALWLPILWAQVRMRVIAEKALELKAPLPSSYFKTFWVWLVFCVAAFADVLVILWMMVTRTGFP